MDLHGQRPYPFEAVAYSHSVEHDVAATARTTASILARETLRPNALFRDPLAEALAGPQAMAALRALPEAVQERFSTYTAVRTRVFDDWLASTTAPPEGVRQVVLLGAGLDSRAFRLDWPPGLQLWELDQAPLLAAKEEILARVAPPARCRRQTVAVDLADPTWPAALRSAGFRSDLPTAWLAEGVLPYLVPEVAIALLDRAASLSPTGSHLAADMVDGDSVVTRNDYLARLRQLNASVKGAPFHFGTNDPGQLLMDHGWSTPAVLDANQVGATFNRTLISAAPSSLPLPRLWFVMAQRR
jgi:methyltransferase (TIGR00027 family)